jgi:hypothetical protein
VNSCIGSAVPDSHLIAPAARGRCFSRLTRDPLSFVLPKESRQRKGAPAAAPVLRTGSLRYSPPAGAAELAPTGLRQSSPFSRRRLRCSAPQRAQKASRCDRSFNPIAPQVAVGFDLSPLPSRRAAQGRRGDVGEDCLSPAGASSAAAPAFRAAQGTDSAALSPNRRDGGVAFSFPTFFWRDKRKRVARQARNLASTATPSAAGNKQKVQP